MYKEEFKTDPPPDIWPPDNTQAIFPADTLLNDLPGSLTFPAVKLSLYIMIIPFIIIKVAYGYFNPFALSGPHFLVFASLLIAGSFGCFLYYLYRRRQEVLRFVEDKAPKRYTIYQAAYFLFGQNRAVQTAIVDGLKKDAIELQQDNSFLVQQDGYDYSQNTNPLLRMLAPYEHTKLSYEQINRLLPAETFQEPAFDNLHRIAYKKKYDHWVFLLPLAIIITARFVQGVWNDQPIFFLVIMAIISGIAAIALASSYSVKQVIYTRCRQKFEEEPLANMKLNSIDEILRTHVTGGTTAVAGFSEYASLALLFGAYPTVNHFNQRGNGNGGCGSSGCGSGDGGGSGCGGGCGGCGGD